ncbi:hypothetical protein Bca4012_024316 [Brassica carinata]
MDLTEPNLPSHPSVELNDVLLVEGNPNLVVTSTITVVMGPQPGWGVWSDGETADKIKEKLKRKRRRSRAGSSFPVFAVKNRRRRTLQTTEHTDHPDHDHHASSNSAQSEQPVNIGSTIIPLPNSPSHKTPVPSFEYHNSTIPNLQDHNSAKSKSADQASSAHPSLVHPSSDHTPTDHTSPTHETSAPKSPEHYSTNLSSPDHRSPSQNSPPPSSPTNILPHHPQLVITTHTSPTHCSATQASLFLQGSPFQHSATIATFPHISLSRIFPTTIYPLPALTTTPTSVSNKSACFSQGFSPHYSATNAFAVTATRKGSPSMIQPTKRLLIDVDERSKDPDNELSDESAEQKIQRVVDELDHMTVLMHMLGERHKDMLQMDKATFTPSALTSLMMSKERQFHAAVMKDKIHWDPRLKKLILVPDKTLIRDVCTVYTPMIWADKHWMGLCINLVMGHVIVFDPLPDLYNDEKALRFLKPILHMLPYLIHYVVEDNVKFMEMHLYYDPHPHMFGITDHNVDKFRQFYAMEAYKTIVLPVYH